MAHRDHHYASIVEEVELETLRHPTVQYNNSTSTVTGLGYITMVSINGVVDCEDGNLSLMLAGRFVASTPVPHIAFESLWLAPVCPWRQSQSVRCRIGQQLAIP